MKLPVALLLVFASHTLIAQDVISLWDGSPPYSKPNTVKEAIIESWGVPCVKNVTHPTLTVYPSKRDGSGHAMIIMPGGGYRVQSFVTEGTRIADYLSSVGIVAAVLKYRLPLSEISDQPHLLPLTDARRAIALMKSMSGKYGYDPKQVGVMGFSAGGHLATAVSVLKSPQQDENPHFSALIYAVTTLNGENQTWLENSLFHRKMTEEEKQQYSFVDNVDALTPPAFLLHAYDDKLVPVQETLHYARALTAAGQQAEVHLFARGKHGFGPGRSEDGTSQWLALLANWIKRQ